MNKKSQATRKAKKKGREAEEYAIRWLRKNEYRILYPNQVKPSNKPYDIVCCKKGTCYAIDVKTGLNARISLRSFIKLLNRSIKDFRSEVKKMTGNDIPADIKKIGYLFVVEGECFLLEFGRASYRAFKAWQLRKRVGS